MGGINVARSDVLAIRNGFLSRVTHWLMDDRLLPAPLLRLLPASLVGLLHAFLLGLFHALWLVILLVLLLGLLLGLMGPFTSAQAQELRIGYVESTKHRQILESLARSYESIYRGEKVTLVPIGRADLETDLLRWLITGEKADLFLVNDQVVGALKGVGAVRYISEIRFRDIRIEDEFASFPVGLQDVFSDERGILGVPLAADAELFQYNESLMNDLGLPPLRTVGDEWTWYDMIDIGRIVAGSAVDRHLLHLDLEFTVIYFLAHGPVYSPDGRSIQLINQGNVGILGLAQQAIHRDRISPPPSAQSGTSQRFQRGQLAMRRVSIESMQPQAVANASGQWRFEWDVVPWPRSPFSNVRPALGDAVGLIVAAGSRALPQIEGFLQIALSSEGQAQLAQDANVFPARLDVWTESILRAQTPVGPPSNREAFVTTLADWQHFLFPTNVEAEIEQLAMPLFAVLEGLMDPETGLRTANELIDRVLRDADRLPQ